MKTTTLSHPVRRRLLRVCGLIAVPGLAAYVCLSLWIGAGVCAVSTLARERHPGDRVEALMRYVEDTRHPLRDRNRAVWALGQLGDRRALPGLRKLHTGGACAHGSALCQRELAKAIHLLDGGVNLSALVWRHAETR
jgi:hypothetical protein